MNLIDTPLFWIPTRRPIGTSAPIAVFAGANLSIASQAIAGIFQFTGSRSINKIGISIDGITTVGDITVSLQTIGSTGNPSGSLYHANSTATVTLVSGDANTWKIIDFAGSFNVSRGDFYAIVIQNSASSVPNFGVMSFVGSAYNCCFPYYAQYDGSTWSKSSVTSGPSVICHALYNGSTPSCSHNKTMAKSYADFSIRTGASYNDTCGFRFKIPFSAKLSAVNMLIEQDGNMAYYLADDDNVTIESTATMLSTNRGSTSETETIILFNDVQIIANKYYRFYAMALTSTSATIPLLYYNSATELFYENIGIDACQIYREVTGSVWKTNTSAIPVFSLGFRGINSGIGSCGGFVC